MYIKIRHATAVPNKHGKNDIYIQKIWAYAEDGKRIKRIKLTDDLANRLVNSPVLIQNENLDKLLD